MRAPHGCSVPRFPPPLALLLLLLLLPTSLPGPAAVQLLAAEGAPGPGPPHPARLTLPPASPPAEAARPRGAEGGNGSTPRGGLAAEGPEGEAGGGGAAGGGLAVSPNPGDKPLTQRALTVLMVVSGAVLVYFVVRTVRMRRRNRKTRRYGVLDTNIENMELTPLEQDDEDDNNTLFDANHPRR
ncbi:membrane protein FAM174A [Tenrec ecaudatus]|uniref:membrane protein FAM174A n=1 Tax=Tenrec ecaudatus TaxID=94439 RepID=UPI003F59DE70